MIIYLYCMIKIIFIYSSTEGKRKHFLDCDISMNRQNQEVILNLLGNVENISKNDYSINELHEEPLDLRINAPDSKRLKSDLKYIKFMNENEKEDNLIKVHTNVEQLNQKEKEYLSFSHIDNLNFIIKQYVTRFMMGKSYSIHYLIRLSKIYQTYKFLSENIEKIKNHQFFFETYDPELTDILHCICSQFKGVENFSENVCDNFLKKLFDMIDSHKDLRPLFNQLKIMNCKERNFFFYAELTKCSRYFNDVPELMTLGGVFSVNSSCNLTLSIHLINLLLDTAKNISEVRVFIFFLIRQSFAYSLKKSLQFFVVYSIQINCTMDYNFLHHYNLHFFLWEMDKHRRKSFLPKLKDKQTILLIEADKVRFKTILLIFLFQQMLFLKLNNAVLEEFDKYIKLIEKIITEENCPICDFNSYLELLKYKK